MTTLELTPSEWQTTYAEYVADFKASKKKASDEIMLTIRLRRLGFSGVRLDEELKHIKES